MSSNAVTTREIIQVAHSCNGRLKQEAPDALPSDAYHGAYLMQSTGAFTQADVVAKIAQVQDTLAHRDWDGSCCYERQDHANLSERTRQLESLATFLGTYGAKVRQYADAMHAGSAAAQS